MQTSVKAALASTREMRMREQLHICQQVGVWVWGGGGWR
jgi:hypothetical protein